MPDVPESTIEAESDLDYTTSYDYDYGLVEDTTGGQVSGTATATSTAQGQIVGATIEGVTDATSTATGLIANASVQGITTATTTATGLIPFVRGDVTAISTATGDITAATPAVDLGTQYQIVRDQTTVESDLYNVQITDTANPFGNFAIAYIDDQSGAKFNQYNRGTRVDFEYSTNNGISYTNRFSGYVVEARELDQQGADSLEVECYSFDQFLRRDTVSNDLSGKTISEALESIIKNDTPVTWNASNVTVVDDQELTRSYRGELVENALKSLRSISGNEAFGVNTSVEFFFEPNEASAAPRNIDNSQWFNYDIPEQGKETINEVTVYYAEGEKSVTVDNGGDKQELQDSLGTSGPVTLAQEVSRPDIDNIEDARDVGEQILDERENTLTGTVTTYGLLDAQPGDVINITIEPRGIDDNFRIAELQYNWGEATTQLTVVEKKGDQDTVIVRLSDSVKRLETQDVNRDGISNRITSTNLGVELPISGDVDGTSFSAGKVTNNLRNQLRDGWADGTTVDITEIAVGNGTSAPSRTDTSLGNELERVNVSESFPDAQSVLYEGGFSTTDIREIGLFDSSGNLLVRATIDDISLSSTVNVDLRIDVENDDEYESGVVTTHGQTSVRDLIADNSPLTPTTYAYGSDGTAATESDTSLGTQEVTTGLDELLIQSADSDDEWTDIVSLNPTDALEIAGGELKAAQSNYFKEGENTDGSNTGFDDGSSDTDISNSNYVSLSIGENVSSANYSYAQWDFTVEYTIPSNDVQFWVRQASNWDGTIGSSSGVPELVWEFEHANGGTYTLDTNNNLGAGLSDDFGWDQLPTFNSGFSISIPDLEPGDYTLRCRVTDSDGAADAYQYWIDCVSMLDGRFSYTFDETTDANDALSGPELYPDLETKQFSAASTRREFDAATAEQTWNDTSNNQFIELSNDGGSNWIRTNNNSTATASFSGSSTELLTNVGISRFSSGGTNTPTDGDSAQAIDVHDLFANIAAITPADTGLADIRGIVPPGSIVGTTLSEAGELDTNGDLLTRVTFAEFTVQVSERIISSEKFSFQNG